MNNFQIPKEAKIIKKLNLRSLEALKNCPFFELEETTRKWYFTIKGTEIPSENLNKRCNKIIANHSSSLILAKYFNCNTETTFVQ